MRMDRLFVERFIRAKSFDLGRRFVLSSEAKEIAGALSDLISGPSGPPGGSDEGESALPVFVDPLDSKFFPTRFLYSFPFVRFKLKSYLVKAMTVEGLPDVKEIRDLQVENFLTVYAFGFAVVRQEYHIEQSMTGAEIAALGSLFNDPHYDKPEITVTGDLFQGRERVHKVRDEEYYLRNAILHRLNPSAKIVRFRHAFWGRIDWAEGTRYGNMTSPSLIVAPSQIPMKNSVSTVREVVSQAAHADVVDYSFIEGITFLRALGEHIPDVIIPWGQGPFFLDSARRFDIDEAVEISIRSWEFLRAYMNMLDTLSSALTEIWQEVHSSVISGERRRFLRLRLPDGARRIEELVKKVNIYLADFAQLESLQGDSALLRLVGLQGAQEAFRINDLRESVLTRLNLMHNYLVTETDAGRYKALATLNTLLVWLTVVLVAVGLAATAATVLLVR